MNKCPKCDYESKPGDIECPRCGIVYEEYEISVAKKRLKERWIRTQEKLRLQEEKRKAEEKAIREKEPEIPSNNATNLSKYLPANFDTKKYYTSTAMVAWLVASIILHIEYRQVHIVSLKFILFTAGGVFFIAIIFGYAFTMVYGYILNRFYKDTMTRLEDYINSWDVESISDMIKEDDMRKMLKIRKILRYIEFVIAFYFTVLCFRYFYVNEIIFW